MTDEDDRRKKSEERRHPSEKDDTAMPRRARDSGRVRKAIRTELEEVAEAGGDTQAEAGIEPGRSPKRNVISLENISLSFEEQILDNVSFAAKEGETIVVVGESGTGKSTILKLLLRLLIPDNGRVAIDGEDITHLTFDDALKVRQKMGMVFQGAALFDSMTVYENVAYPLREHTTLTEDEIEARVREKLQFVDLEADKVMDQMPSELSGGMKKRVGIARGLANNPEIMLYDEPTSGLDPLTTATITYLILKLQRELGVTSVVVSHDIRSAFRMASKIALLENKKIGFFGTPEEMTGSDDPYIREFLGGF
jgi:phospholipid/cholesterol/gamma-HCH transport system ATP-binding protein